MKFRNLALALSSAALLATVGVLSFSNVPVAVAKETQLQKPQSPTAEIKWMTIEEAFAANQKKPRKIFIDVYTDWCGWCKRMDENTFKNETVAAYMNQHYYAVKFNAEQRETINLGGYEYKFKAQGNKGVHDLAVALMQGRMSYPTVVVMSEEFKVLQPIPGYREPVEMMKVLEFYAQNQHLKGGKQ